MADAIFQLTVISQNDPECQPIGSELSVVVDEPWGGTLTGASFPTGTPVPLPIPPGPGHTAPPSPTWFLTLDGTIENARYTLTISGPDGANPTTITIDGRDMPGWVARNEKEKTNQIYKEANCGIFGFAQKNVPPGQPTYWIYTVTGGVHDPKIHPPADTARPRIAAGTSGARRVFARRTEEATAAGRPGGRRCREGGGRRLRW